MRAGEPNLPTKRVTELTEKRWESIRSKCHPAIFELAQLRKESLEALKALGPNPPAELVAQITARAERQAIEIHVRHSGVVQPAPDTFPAQTIYSESALNSSSHERGVIEWLHFQRHGVPLKADIEKIRAKDYDASRRVQRTLADLEQIRCGQGQIQAFKGNSEHSGMFQTLMGLGLEKLTPEELADFFDRYCPCDSDAHDPGALKKHRKLFLNALKEIEKHLK